MKFDTHKNNFSLPTAEAEVLEFWKTESVFDKTNELAKDRPHFVFYEGPPTANGRPGIHHVISRTIKDLICRYKAMQGFRVDRKGGWDTQGLPVEMEVQKALKLGSKLDIEEYGVDKFNQKCRESVWKYLSDWDAITERTGYWLDLEGAYSTMTNDYIESVWWILKTFFDRDLIYKGYKTLPFCPHCETGLSSHEVAQGYQDVRDPSIFVKVKAADDDFSYLVWTTTPWTLPSNAALCLKADADYVIIDHEGEKLLLAEALVEKVFGETKPAISRHKGTDFLKRRYEPMFDTFKNKQDEAFFVINADFVTMEDGTGIVHIAPGFGADDYQIGHLEYGLPVFQAIEANGIFKDFAGPYKGMFIKDADPIITKDLKIAGKLFKKEQYQHNYPFCWRCDSPLIYIARQSWYIRTTKFKEQLIANNNAINWHPDTIRTGRMLDWLENNVDWSLSRERFWGTPLPIWECDDRNCDKLRAIGSIEELRREGENVPEALDLHKPVVDDIRLTCECGSSMTRVPEVIDCWFDSGSMPYAQWHYPFENKEEFERKYPADFISEAVDQTRGWFYSLLAISTMLFDKPPFKNVIVIEFILDKLGKKMSKHKGNVVDPFETVEEYGADPTRWYMLSVSNPWVPTKFDIAGLTEVVRKYFDTLRNTHSFFTMYANIDRIVERSEEAGQSIDEFLQAQAGEPTLFDRWIISRFNSLTKDVVERFDAYDITAPVRAMQHFLVEELSNWYVRTNRRRFWAGDENEADKMRAYLTLYRVMVGLCRLTAPITPMVSEHFWKALTPGKSRTALSVHMTDYPKPDTTLIDTTLEKTMSLVEKVVSLGRAARSKANLKVRQPLAEILISLPLGADYEGLRLFEDIILGELNVKAMNRAERVDEFVTYSAKLNFKNAGSRLGAKAKGTAKALAALSSDEVKPLLKTGKLEVELDGGDKVTLTADEVEVIQSDLDGWAVTSEGDIASILPTVFDEDLKFEGYVRDWINQIQKFRKSSGCEVTDRVQLRWYTDDDGLREATKERTEDISGPTLADSFVPKQFDTVQPPPGSTQVDIMGIPATIWFADDDSSED